MVLTITQRIEHLQLRKDEKELKLNNLIRTEKQLQERQLTGWEEFKIKRIGEIEQSYADELKQFPNNAKSIENRKNNSLASLEQFCRRNALKIKNKFSKKDVIIRSFKLDIELLEVQIEFLQSKLPLIDEEEE